MHINPFSDFPVWSRPDVPFARPEDARLHEHFKNSSDDIERLTDVTRPAFTFYPATGNTQSPGPRPCVLVVPGGAYEILAWNHEGKDIAAWLNTNGISAALLKYRCPNRKEGALADAIRAMRLLRAHASEWNIRPDRVGVIGFSAGAHLCGRLCNLPDGQLYPPADAADKLSPRPDFAFIIYPAYFNRENFSLDPDIAVTKATPPTFLMQAEDDTLVDSSLAYFIALKKAGVPAEMHIFSHGGHGYGMFRNGNPTEDWPALAIKWFSREIARADTW